MFCRVARRTSKLQWRRTVPYVNEVIHSQYSTKRKLRVKGSVKSSSKAIGVSLGEALKKRGTAPKENIIGLNPDSHKLEALHLEGKRKIPGLSHGLDRVLFNPGVVYLQDPRSRVFNFDPYLQKILPVTEFDFDAIGNYITSSQDVTLEKLARQHGKKFIGSTSSMTSVLAHFHYLISAWRPLSFDHISKSFSGGSKSFTNIMKNPASIFLRYKGDGVYAIDADKEFDTENVLSLLGHAMEKFLTLPRIQYEKYHLENSHTLDEETRNAPESYHYSSFGDFLMRSQLDAHDPRLPGSGMFDLKTRAVLSVRLDVQNFHLASGYQIRSRTGLLESFEREYYDMIRAAFLKYSLQVRMGAMDGIFVAFHNTEKIFGFQYISIDEMDTALHGTSDNRIGDSEFKLSLELLNKLLNRATEKYPKQSLRLHFETRDSKKPYMYFFAESLSEDEIIEIQRGERGDVKQFLEKLAVKLNHRNETNIQENMEKPAETITDLQGTDLNQEKIVPTQTLNPPQDQETIGAQLEEDVTVATQDSAGGGRISDADVEDISKDNTDILGLTLIVSNHVNGNTVVRPERLTKEDIWTINYSIAQIESLQKARTVYQTVKNRRKKAIRSEEDKPHPLLIQLRQLSQDGRKWEAEQNAIDTEKAPVVYQSSKR